MNLGLTHIPVPKSLSPVHHHESLNSDVLLVMHSLGISTSLKFWAHNREIIAWELNKDLYSTRLLSLLRKIELLSFIIIYLFSPELDAFKQKNKELISLTLLSF